MIWHQLADRLGMSLQRCQQETTSTQFVRWCDYLEQDLNRPSRGDYYLAQIAMEIRRGYVKTPANVKLEHFLLEFSKKEGPKKPRTEEEREQWAAASKARWLGMVMSSKTKTPPTKE